MDDISELIQRQKLGFLINIYNNKKCLKVLNKMGELYNATKTRYVNPKLSKINKSCISDFMGLTKLDVFVCESLQMKAIEEHAKLKIKYELMLRDNDISEDY